MTPRTPPIVTPVQFAFLAVLSGTTLTGKQMRTELAQIGVEERESAFFRVIQRLKRDGLIKATRVPRDPDEYRGAQCVYELTQAGKDAVAVMRGLYRRTDRHVRRLRWGRTRSPKLCRRFSRSAEQAEASRSDAK